MGETHVCQVAIGMRMRILGIRSVPTGAGVIIAGKSVHGFGLRAPLAVIGIDRTASVVDVRMLGRRDVVTIEHSVVMVEVPLRSPLLALDRGDKVTIGRVRRWPARSTSAQHQSETSAT